MLYYCAPSGWTCMYTHTSGRFNSKYGKCATSYRVKRKKHIQNVFQAIRSKSKLENGFLHLWNDGKKLSINQFHWIWWAHSGKFTVNTGNFGMCSHLWKIHLSGYNRSFPERTATPYFWPFTTASCQYMLQSKLHFQADFRFAYMTS